MRVSDGMAQVAEEAEADLAGALADPEVARLVEGYHAAEEAFSDVATEAEAIEQRWLKVPRTQAERDRLAQLESRTPTLRQSCDHARQKLDGLVGERLSARLRELTRKIPPTRGALGAPARSEGAGPERRKPESVERRMPPPATASAPAPSRPEKTKEKTMRLAPKAKACSVAGCGTVVQGRGLCVAHYCRARGKVLKGVSSWGILAGLSAQELVELLGAVTPRAAKEEVEDPSEDLVRVSSPFNSDDDQEAEENDAIADELKLDGEPDPPPLLSEPPLRRAVADTLAPLGAVLAALEPLSLCMQRATLDYAQAVVAERFRQPTPAWLRAAPNLLATDGHGHLLPGAHP